jgi:hypothetical protein
VSESLLALRDALGKARYHLGAIEEERSFLAENTERVLWTTLFDTPAELLECWQAIQTEAIERTQALSPEKSWELYLLLATEVEADPESEADIDAVRRDTSYARKVLALGVEGLSPVELDNYLSPLRELEVSTERSGPDALTRLGELVAADADPDVASVLAAFEANRPLFGEL